MPKSYDELLDLALAGDEEAGQELKTLYLATQQQAAASARTLRLKTDANLRERYPRAIKAFEKGRLRLGDDINDDQMLDALREKEDELAELGVPLETAAPIENPHSDGPGLREGAVVGAGAEDPAQALAGGRAAASPGGQPRDFMAEFMDKIKGPTIHDRYAAFALLPELNQTPQGKAKIREITAMLEARPIITRLV